MVWHFAQVSFACSSLPGISWGFTVVPLSSVSTVRSAVAAAASLRSWHDRQASFDTSVFLSFFGAL